MLNSVDMTLYKTAHVDAPVKSIEVVPEKPKTIITQDPFNVPPPPKKKIEEFSP